jgi:hypothetical protein
VIARLSEPAQLPAALVDQVLDATDQERAAAGELRDRTRAFLEQSGAIKPSMSVLQLRHNQVEVLAAIYGLVSRWWAAPGWRDRSLGDILNVAPTDVAETVMRTLRVTGFLPPAAEPEEEQERRRQRPPPAGCTEAARGILPRWGGAIVGVR